MNDGRDVLVEIGTMEILSHRVYRREIREAIDWATKNRELLIAKYKDHNP